MARAKGSHETMVRTYSNPGSYSRDARKLSSQGWYVANTVHRQPRAGIGRILTLGLLTLIWPPKPIIVVTYARAQGVSAPAPYVYETASPEIATGYNAPLPVGQGSEGMSMGRIVLIAVILIIILVVVF